jgi:DNA-binding NarL/FixJ family response regulator
MTTILIEDHALVRDLFRAIIASNCLYEIVGEAASLHEALSLVGEIRAELIVLDLGLPDGDGLQIAEYIRSNWPIQPQIVVMTARIDARTIYRVEQAGIDGFIDKCSLRVEALREGLLQMEKGRNFFSNAFQEIRRLRRSDPLAFDKILSNQEQRVLSMVGALYSDSEIAIALNIAVRTAETHRFTIMKKLDLHGRNELLRYARDNGFSWGMPVARATDMVGEIPKAKKLG